MKLIHSVSIRISVLAALVLGAWAVAFYFAIMEEVNDETDDALEDYAETIIIRSLVGEPLPTASTGSNNQYYRREVSRQYADTHPHVKYEDRDVYIREKHEYEPARVLTYIYTDDSDRYYELEVSTPTIEKDDLRQAIVQWLLILFAALLVGIIAVSVYSVHRTMRPLHQLLQWIGRFRLGQDNPPLRNPTRITEFRRLNQSVEESFRQGERQYEQQKQFLGHAAHELQTPIAVCIARLEMMLEETEMQSRNARFQACEVADEPPTQAGLSHLLRTMKHLSRLNHTLLTLYRIENGQYADRQPTDTQPLLTSLLDDLQTVFAHRRISVSTHSRAPFTPDINAELLQMLLTNLLKNAFIHNIDGGSIDITADSRSLTIANTGSCEPLDADKVFRPFVHTPGNSTSTGLGLAIARAICRHNGLDISYRFLDRRHTFTITSATRQTSKQT